MCKNQINMINTFYVILILPSYSGMAGTLLISYKRANRAILGSEYMLVDIHGKGVVMGVFINLHFSKGGYHFARKILGGVIIIRKAENVKSPTDKY